MTEHQFSELNLSTLTFSEIIFIVFISVLMSQSLLSLDRFNEGQTIGRGSFAVVKLAEDKETKKKYAAKIIIDNDPLNKEFALNSIRFMEQVQHPTLVKFIGYSPIDFTGGETLTLITEYAEHGDLSRLIRENTLNNTQLQIILVGISRAIMLFHQNNFIHRDIKPENIFIDENYHPHLGGFMLITKLEPGIPHTECVGTYPFMAPEVFESTEYSTPIDIYSFAVTMYEIVTGNTTPYPKTSSFALMKDVINGRRPEFKVEVKQSIRELIEHCWSAETSKRLTAEQLFQKLAYDANYYLDDVDSEKVISYANSIKE